MLARGYSLFGDRMRHHAAEIGDVFERGTGMPMEDYYLMAAYVVAEGLGRPVEGLGDPNKCGMFSAQSCEEAVAFGPLARAFFAKEAQTADDLRGTLWGDRQDAGEADTPALALKPFRDRPILRAPDGRAIVLDPPSFIERLSVGPLFHIVDADPAHANRWFALFGEGFQEYSAALLERVYPHVVGLVRRYTPSPMGSAPTGSEVEIADGLLVDGQDAVLIEMKARWIRDDVGSPDQNGAAYIDAVRRRYAVGAGDQGADAKAEGVGQLARSIQQLTSGAWRVKDVDLDESARLIPVLLVHDPHMDAPVHSHVLAQEFAELMRGGSRIDDWSEMRAGTRRVAHLIVLTLDDLEMLETSSNHFAIIECLREYAASCLDRMTSFHNFLRTSRFRPLLRYNAWLAERAEGLLGRARTRLFPLQRVNAGRRGMADRAIDDRNGPLE